MNKRKLRVILIIVSFCLALSLSGSALSFFRSVAASSARNHGPIKAIGVGIYSDSGCTRALDFENWGVLEPGASQNLTFYVRNEGRRAVSLSLYETNWNPSNVSQYVALQWDYGGKPLSPSQVVAITLTLALSTNAPFGLAFTFESVINSAG